MTAERDMILLDQLFNEYRFHLLTVFESIGIIVILILFISYEIYRRKTSKAEAELEIAKQQIAMNTKEWIKPYRDAIDQQYKLDDVAQQDVDFFFTKLEKFAAGFPDQGSFATQFLQSPLYQEYTNLFTKYQQMGITPSGETVEQATETLKRENREASMEEHIKSTAEREARIAVTRMLPDEVNEVRWNGGRTLPVIGPIIQWVDNIKWIRRLLGKK